MLGHRLAGLARLAAADRADDRGVALDRAVGGPGQGERLLAEGGELGDQDVVGAADEAVAGGGHDRAVEGLVGGDELGGALGVAVGDVEPLELVDLGVGGAQGGERGGERLQRDAGLDELLDRGRVGRGPAGEVGQRVGAPAAW